MTNEELAVFLPKERLIQKYRTLDWPGVEPALSSRYRGRPELRDVACGSCRACLEACPAGALERFAPGRTPSLDMGKCVFCGACAKACQNGAIAFGNDYRLAARCRQELVARPEASAFGVKEPAARNILRKKGIFGRSFKLRQVSAGGCNACEADCNVLGTLVYDLGRFGVEFTASPRHADAIVVTGPISLNMLPALLAAWRSVPGPRVLAAVGTCAISGGLFRQSGVCAGDFDGCVKACAEMDLEIPEDFRPAVMIPGCPPTPWSILEGLLLARQTG